MMDRAHIKKQNSFKLMIRKTNRFGYERLLPALLWVLFARGRIQGLTKTSSFWETAHSAAYLSFTLLVILLFLLRRPVVGKRSDIKGAVVAILGTFSPWLFSLSEKSDHIQVIEIGTTITIIGLLFSLLSLAALGRCFGIFPEARGLVTRGPYSLVRHPLYLGEITMALGISISFFSVMSIAIWILIVILQLWRAKYEEQALLTAFPEYSDYQKRTKRVIPLVW